MKVTFLGQPFQSFGGWTYNWFKETVANPELTRLQIATAWIKRSALSRITTDIDIFKLRGGNASVVVGIDEGGATKEGLSLARDLFNAVYIFHDSASRTFHPKVYFASGSTQARLLVGSSNATAGGLFTNFEASLSCELDLHSPEDQILATEVQKWFDILYEDEVCKPLTSELLEILIRDPRYKISAEGRRNLEQPGLEDDADGITDDTPERSIFGTSSTPKAGRPPHVDDSRPGNTVGVVTTLEPAPPKQPSVVPEVASQLIPVLVWKKQLEPSDAQHPPKASTNRTHALRLASGKNDVDSAIFFRHKLFGSALWTSEQESSGIKEEAVIPFHVTINRESYGQVNLRVSHVPHREAGQSNIQTVLHWGRTLQKVLRATNYTGWIVVIRLLAKDSYTLTITRDDL